MTQAPILHAAAPDKCDVRISWVLAGANALYTSFDWIKYTETALPAATVARTVGKMARAQAFENVHGEQFRAKVQFMTMPEAMAELTRRNGGKNTFMTTEQLGRLMLGLPN